MNNICIIGNGSSSLKENGEFIDNCDLVIRIKNFKIKGYEKYIGSKTNIWCTKWFSFEENEEKLNLDFNKTKIWLPILNPLSKVYNKDLYIINQYMFSNCFSDKKINLDIHYDLSNKVHNNISYLDEEELDYCLKILNINSDLILTKSGINTFHPTTYLFCILLCLKRYKDIPIYISGFDGFTQGYYWNSNQVKKHSKTWPHLYEKEKLYIKKLIYSNKIKLI